MDQHVELLDGSLEEEELSIYPFDPQDYNQISPYYPYYIGPISVLRHISPFLTIIFITRVLHLLQDIILPNVKLKSSISLISSALQLHYYMGLSYLNVSLIWGYVLISTSYQPTRTRHRNKSLGIILANELIILFGNETIQSDSLKLRTILMVLSMKTICSDSPNFAQRLDYLIHPASFLFGPWHRHQSTSYKQCNSSSHIALFLKQLFKATKILIQASLILMISSIISNFSDSFLNLIPEDYSISLYALEAYLRALEFRLTHYFICYLSECFMSFWLYDINKQIQVCKILKIEWPRSLVEVVVFWNVPMHSWLKEFIFKPNKHLGRNLLITVLYTYLISSLLHGFKFHIWAVLLSLGLFTYIEHGLREKLARKINACVLSKRCQYDGQSCVRKHTRTSKNSIIVTVINATFRIWAIMQLAYLGCIFVGDTDRASYRNALNIWSELNYFGHYLALVTFLLSWTI